MGDGLLLRRLTGLPSPALLRRKAGGLGALFSGGHLGVWLEVAPGLVFSDEAGTVPAGVGDPVWRLVDQSGGGFDAVAPSSGARPTVGLDEEGRWFLAFNGASSALVTGLVGFAQTDSVGSVGVAYRGTSGGVGYVWNASGDSLAAGTTGLIYWPTHSYDEVRIRRGAATANSHMWTHARPLTIVNVANWAASSGMATWNGTAFGFEPGPEPRADPFRLGSRVGGAFFGGRFYGAVGRLGSMLSGAEHALVTAWLAERSGATLASGAD